MGIIHQKKDFMKRQTFLLLSGLIGLLSAHAQTEIGADYRYNFGRSFSQHAIGGSLENFSGRNSWTVGISYNFSKIHPPALGLHAGYRYSFSPGTSGNFLLGFNTSISFEKSGGANATRITPSLEAGYHHTFNNFGKGAFVTPTLGAGYSFRPGGGNEREADDEALFNVRVMTGYRF